MSIPVRCQCGKQFAAKPELAGKQVRCPSCGNPLRIPQPQPVPPKPQAGVAVACTCGSQFLAAPHLYGKRVACPTCGTPLSIPSPAVPQLQPLSVLDDDPLALPPTPAAPAPARRLQTTRATKPRSRGLPFDPRYLIIGGVALVLLIVVVPLGWMAVRAGAKLVAGLGSPQPEATAEKSKAQTEPQPNPPQGSAVPTATGASQPAAVPIEQPVQKTAPPTPALRYGWQQGQKYRYQYTLKADLMGQAITGEGEITYSPEPPGGAAPVAAERSEATGTAFLVSPAGHLVTCAHVVKGATRIDVHFGDRQFEGKVLALDTANDLAVLKIPVENLVPLPLGNAQAVQLAESVRIVGYPLTDVLGRSIKVTQGSIAGIIERTEGRLFQVDGSVNPGNSGGPVINERGHVVGVTSARLSGIDVSNVGFVIPADRVQHLLDRQQVRYQTAEGGGGAFSGPELANRVTPSVALLRVNLGAGGAGSESRVALSYTGRLQMKWPSLSQPSGGGGPFGPEPAGPPRPFGGGPFGGDPFGGGPRGADPFAGGPRRSVPDDTPSNENGKILVDVAGEYYQGEMKIFLPFVMTPLGLLAIEPLGDGEPVWHRERVVTLSGGDEEEDPSPFGGFHPSAMDPFAPPGPGRRRQRQPAEVVTAMERYEYRLGESSADTVVLQKTYRLETLQPKDDQPNLNVSGTGQVVFNKKDGVPQSMTCSTDFVIQQKGIAIKIPATFSYQRAGP